MEKCHGKSTHYTQRNGGEHVCSTCGERAFWMGIAHAPEDLTELSEVRSTETPPVASVIDQKALEVLARGAGDDFMLVPRGVLAAALHLIKRGRSGEQLQEVTETRTYESLHALASGPEFCRGKLYTCEGKGGRYLLLGDTTGAGDTKGRTFTFYMDMDSPVLRRFCRNQMDFTKRMKPL